MRVFNCISPCKHSIYPMDLTICVIISYDYAPVNDFMVENIGMACMVFPYRNTMQAI